MLLAHPSVPSHQSDMDRTIAATNASLKQPGVCNMPTIIVHADYYN